MTKKIIAFALLLNVVLLAGRFWQERPANAQQNPSRACGDVDDSGSVNITDAVYLLNWLFNGGPAPTCPPSGGGSLPDTGQTLCYDDIGAVIDCTSATCAGQDGFYAAGCPSEGRFVDNGDGTVTDNCTGLMWQKDTGNDGFSLTWCAALVYCERARLAGHDDWRLPNVRELQSIVDYGRRSPSIDPVVGALAGRYWSSTSNVDGPDLAWFVYFLDGEIFVSSKDIDGLVLAVRSGP